MELTKKTGLVLSLSAFALSATNVNAQNKKPNVIFILADDLGYGDVGCYGQKIIKTPNIDSLAKRGMRFTDFYAGCTVSAPSRASLMTGLHTGHTKIRGNIEIQPEGQEAMANVPTIANVFKNAGYKTGIFGKWGLGSPKSGAEPLDRGFDQFFGYNCQREAHSYYPDHLYNNRDRYEIKENTQKNKTVYAPDLIQDYAERFIQTAVKDKKPFFACLTYTLPHAELNLPHDGIYDMYDGKVAPKPWDKGGYNSTPDAHRSFAAMITRLDMYIGRVVELVKQLGVDDNTIIIFTSDNGPHLEGGADPDYFNSNGPLKGYKRDLYEGGVREPMIVVWDGKIKAGSINHTPGAFWDFMPTFKELVGDKSKAKTDGISLMGQFKGEKATDKMINRPFYWEFHEDNGKLAIREGVWKFIINGLQTNSPKVELYNLCNDLGEENNIYKEYPQKVDYFMKKALKMRSKNELFPFKIDNGDTSYIKY